MNFSENNSYCRICLTYDQKLEYSLFEKNLLNLLKECFSIHVNVNNGFSTKICLKCYTTIIATQNLKENFLNSQKILENSILLKKDPDENIFKSEFLDTEYNQAKYFCDASTQYEQITIENNSNKNGINDLKFRVINEERKLKFNFYSKSFKRLKSKIKFKHDEKNINCKKSKKHSIKIDDKRDNNVIENNIQDSLESNSDNIITNSDVEIKNEANYYCLLCSLNFTTKQYLRQHNKTEKHKNNMKFKNNDLLISDDNLFDLKEDDEYNCNECDEKFFDLKCLNQHRIEKHNDLNENYCNVCDKVFLCEQTYLRHLNKATHLNNLNKRSNHKRKERQQHKNKAETQGIIRYEKLPEFRCVECNHTYFFKEKWSVHMLKHSSENSNQSLETSSANKSSTTNKNKPQKKCTFCDRYFTDTFTLTRHINHHKGIIIDTKVVCHICGMRVKLIQSHLRDVHDVTDRSKHSCKICKNNTQFNSRESLMEHLKNEHSTTVNKERVACPTCGLSICKVRLNKHIRNVHLNIRPFPCDVCKRMFKTEDNLKSHYRMHTDDRPFQCDVCFKNFRHKRTMHIHRSVHTGERFRCDLCEKSFTQKGCILPHKKKSHPEAFVKREIKTNSQNLNDSNIDGKNTVFQQLNIWKNQIPILKM